MADKEERIIIAVAEPSLLEGGADKIYPCMTRQEAIDIMAEGMCNRATEAIKSKETVVFDFGFYAEAALNALLEGEKK